MPNPGLAYKLAEQVASAAVSSFPAAAAPANDVSLGAAVRWIADGTRKASGTAVATGKSLVDALGSDGTTVTRTNGTNIAGEFLALPRCVVKTDGAVLTGTDALFTISGGMVRATFYARVTTIIGAGTSNAKLTHTTTAPAATIDLCSAVDIDGDAAGTSYRWINTTGVLTPVTAGAVLMGNAFATDDMEYLLVPGSIGLNCTAAATGVIEVCMMYTPLSPASLVVAAA